MKMRGLLALGGLLLFATSGIAQDAPATHVYEAYYHVKRSDMPEWNRMYHEISVPILNDLVDEGVISGWDQWLHGTGGEYNVRLAIRVPSWASIDTFWSEFLERPDSIRNATGRMIQDHKDEIWNIVDAGNAPAAGVRTNFLYVSTQQINFADMEEWQNIWTDIVGPILAEARDDGLLLGYVILGHNTGGPQNSKVLYFFDEWDNIDDTFEFLAERMDADHPAASDTLNRMRGAHDDFIYEPTPEAGD